LNENMNLEKARLIVEMIFMSIRQYMENKKSGSVFYRIDFHCGGIARCREVELREKELQA
jgi:hypothetical protein